MMLFGADIHATKGHIHGTSIDKRFWSRVSKTSSCWLWIGDKQRGYGKFGLGAPEKKMIFAYKYAYLTHKGSIPDGLVIDHICRVRECVNPAHLRLVTVRENTLIGNGPTAKNAAKTHCIRGHVFDFENTLILKEGYRVCRACKRYWYHARWKHEIKAQRMAEGEGEK